MHWVRCPTDGRLHAVDPTDTRQAAARGYAEALCGHRLPAEGLAVCPASATKEVKKAAVLIHAGG